MHVKFFENKNANEFDIDNFYLIIIIRKSIFKVLRIKCREKSLNYPISLIENQFFMVFLF